MQTNSYSRCTRFGKIPNRNAKLQMPTVSLIGTKLLLARKNHLTGTFVFLLLLLTVLRLCETQMCPVGNAKPRDPTELFLILDLRELLCLKSSNLVSQQKENGLMMLDEVLR